MSIGERLKILRNNKNLKLKELAEFLEISDAIISKYENNKSIPTATIIEKYCIYFNVTADFVIFGKSTSFDNELYELYTQLNDEYKIIAKYKIKELIKEQNQEENNKDFKNIG